MDLVVFLNSLIFQNILLFSFPVYYLRPYIINTRLDIWHGYGFTSNKPNENNKKKELSIFKTKV